MTLKSHKDLDVWKLSMELVLAVYKLTDTFPQKEVYGLSSQLRRASVSIPSNIAEGAARNHTKEFTQFLYVALGSLAELETQLIIALKLNYLADMSNLSDQMSSIRRMTIGLINSLQKRKS